MSLPPLLLERLKRRKIIRDLIDDNSDTEPARTVESRYQETHLVETEVVSDQEEIIAEDYSDEDTDLVGFEGSNSARSRDDREEIDNGSKDTSQDLNKRDDSQSLIFSTESVIGCPNKYNIYHDCSQYCIENFSDIKDLSPTLEQRKQLALVLRTYPMSNEWTVVYDPGVRTFYFWNIISNLVSWFPPGMNGFVSLSSNQIRKTLKDMEISSVE